MATLKKIYTEKIIPDLKERFKYKSVMQVPRLTKITLNMGVGEAAADKKVIDYACQDMALIAGQKPIVTKARKSIAGFKIRDGWPLGCKVTLRGDRMYDFLERFVAIAVPRIRDFRGFNAHAFDGRGNYSCGITEQIVFPEVDYDKIDTVRGLDVCFTTSARTDEEARALLESFHFPLKKIHKEKAED